MISIFIECRKKLNNFFYIFIGKMHERNHKSKFRGAIYNI